MININWTCLDRFFKPLLLFIACAVILNGCSTNPATGKSQFTALMSPAQEVSIGASEHKKIENQFGFYEDQALVSYVRGVGARVTANTERPDVKYKFYILDSPVVNAFALPGGYVYVSRGLLALADNEAELAAVLSHETGHITARHSAERYSHGVLTSLGAAVLSAAVDNSGVSQALGVGSNLYLSSYSRDQEREADTLGLRYMSRSGYDPAMMSSFLGALQNQTAIDNRLNGKEASGVNGYFSTHPATSERVSQTLSEAKFYGQGGNIGREIYMSAIDGLVYGDSSRQGFARGQGFFHPGLDFTFNVPDGFRIINQTSQVVATSKSSEAVILFDMAANPEQLEPALYLSQRWMKGEILDSIESISINGAPAATAVFSGRVGGQNANIRVIAIQWGVERMARFQVAIPENASATLINALKSSTYSLRRLTAQEKQSLKPYQIKIITARAGDSVSSLARSQPFTQLQQERFRGLNGMGAYEKVKVGQRYKLVSGD